MCCPSIRSEETTPPLSFFFFNLKRIALVVTHDLRITGEVDDIYIGDLNTYFDFAKFTKANKHEIPNIKNTQCTCSNISFQRTRHINIGQM
jgi:hypothetical protein